MVVRKLFRIAFAFALLLNLIASHLTFFASHFAFTSHFLHFFSHFRIFFHLPGQYFMVIAPKRLWKVPEKCAKQANKCEKCENVRHADAMRKWNQNLHRIALHYCNKKSLHSRIFLQSICIALPSLFFYHFFTPENYWYRDWRWKSIDHWNKNGRWCKVFIDLTQPWPQGVELAAHPCPASI